jgi:hypothetical protein
MKKIIALILVAVIAVSAFSLMATAGAMPFMRWKNIPHGHGILRSPNLQTSYVRLNGVINQLGSTSVNGSLQAQSRTFVINNTDSKQGAAATALWTTNTPRPINALRAKENFTYTFYAARLIDLNVSALNIDGNDFFMNGTWTVTQVKTSFTIITNADGNVTSFHRDQDGTALATQAYGELKVTGTSFSLAIEGIDTLNGSVYAQRITTRMFNPFKISNDTADTLTNADVTSLAKAYGTMPGWGNYDQRMDYNFNYKIDICDLATAASNVNT